MESDEMAVCPHCGGDLPVQAKVCPHCGSDERTGWSDDVHSGDFGLLDDDEYEENVASEFPELAKNQPKKMHLSWQHIVAAVMLVLMITVIIKKIR